MEEMKRSLMVLKHWQVSSEQPGQDVQGELFPHSVSPGVDLPLLGHHSLHSLQLVFLHLHPY